MCPRGKMFIPLIPRSGPSDLRTQVQGEPMTTRRTGVHPEERVGTKDDPTREEGRKGPGRRRVDRPTPVTLTW